MRRYMTAFWILLIFSVPHLALAAPVAVGEILEVRSNSVGALRDGIAAWGKRKRMDSDDEDHWSTNQAYWKPKADNPGSDPDPDVAPGSYNEEDKLGSGSSWYSEQTESDARGPDRYYNNLPDDHLYFESDVDFYYDSEDDLYTEGDGAKSDSNKGAKSDDSNGRNDNRNGGYDGDSDDSDDTVRSGQASAKDKSLGPKSEHPAAPTLITYLEKILKGSFKLRPRNSGSGPVGMPKRELQGTVDTKAARGTSATSVVGSDAVRSIHDLPVHRQNRRKWILDRLDKTME